MYVNISWNKHSEKGCQRDAVGSLTSTKFIKTFFLLIWLKGTKMKLRPYFTMERVQKLMKKT